MIINGGDFGQQIVNNSDAYDLIYVMDNATVEINGGTFKSVTPDYTLVVKAGSSAKILVRGGSFYKYDPSNDPNGIGAIFIADGYKVEQDGDWYKVVAE